VDDAELERLLVRAERGGLALVEDYNYLFNPPVEQLLEAVASGRLGEVVHTDVTFCSDVLGAGSPFTDPDVRHPAADLPGGAIGDFVTHLASLADAVAGSHREVRVAWTRGAPATDMVALVEAERGTATLRFSARARPQAFTVRVSGSELSATASLFGERLTFQREATWRRPLQMARRGVEAGIDGALSSLAGPWSRLSGGPGSYVGIGRLIERTYDALREGSTPPVTPDQVRAVNRLRADILAQEGPA
jgi:predicted dehydrogenase